MAPALSYTGRILACEEYALRGEDFCKWARQPNRGVDARRSLALENRFPLAHGGGAHLGGGSDWRPWHLLLILLVVGCVALMARDELRRTGGGGGGWHHRDEEDEEDEERDNDYESERRRGAAAAFSGRMSFKRTLRRKVDVVEREGLPWKCS
ncbi:hypothetical protein KJ359_001608 [Pestalotiopsis sp. 9143b]|nr:hypothetical protein KJ359_001608 [Pestalotiopsis sp. 9143b]